MFAILFEVLLIEIQEEIHRFAGCKGGVRGTKIVNKNFVNKLAFPNIHYMKKYPPKKVSSGTSNVKQLYEHPMKSKRCRARTLEDMFDVMSLASRKECAEALG